MFDFSPETCELHTLGSAGGVRWDSINQKIQFNGGGAIRILKKAAHAIGTQQFCIECPGVEFASLSGDPRAVAHWDWAADQRSWFLTYLSASSELAFFWSTNGQANAGSLKYSWTPTLNTPYDLAAERDDSNVLRLYVDGAVVASTTVTDDIWNSTADLTWGCYLNNDSPENFLSGKMAGGPRITIGAHRYGGAYTPPTMPWPTS